MGYAYAIIGDVGPAAFYERAVGGMPNSEFGTRYLCRHAGEHIVRRLLDAVDHPVSRLVRTKIGEVQLGHQRPGTLRKLNPVEIAQLYKAVGL